MKLWHWGHSRGLGVSLCVWGSLALLGVGGVGCAGRGGGGAPADYSGQAQDAYEKAVGYLESSDYLEAIKELNFVRTKFPYSKYAALAALRIGDAYFNQEQWADAVASYRRFAQLHPTHPELPYAQYRIALSFYEQLPGDWFFLPPSYERELASTEDAERECQRFLELYPNASYAEEVAEKLRLVRQRLADHEFYVASFYLNREQPRAAAARLTALLERYPGLGFDEEALFLLGKSYLLLKDVAQAVGIWERLIAQYPDHALSGEAERYIARYGLASVGGGVAAPAAPAASPPTVPVAAPAAVEAEEAEAEEAAGEEEEVEEEVEEEEDPDAFKLKLSPGGGGGLKLGAPEGDGAAP